MACMVYVLKQMLASELTRCWFLFALTQTVPTLLPTCIPLISFTIVPMLRLRYLFTTPRINCLWEFHGKYWVLQAHAQQFIVGVAGGSYDFSLHCKAYHPWSPGDATFAYFTLVLHSSASATIFYCSAWNPLSSISLGQIHGRSFVGS